MVAGRRLIKQTKIIYFRRGWVGMVWKWYEEWSKECQRKMFIQLQTIFRRKKGEILSESDVFENIKKGIKTRFQIKAIEHNE